MKHYSLILFALILFNFSQAQIVNIPDANFKYYLVNSTCADLDNDGYAESTVDTNNDGEIQISEAEAVYSLEVTQECVATSIIGIEAFVNLIEFKCLNSLVINLDLSFMTNMRQIEISNNNNLIDINLSGVAAISRHFYCDNNVNLESLNMINLTTLGGTFYFNSNNLVSNLDLRNLLTIGNYLDITDNQPTEPLSVNLSSLTNVNLITEISDNNLENINLDNLETIHGFFFKNNSTITDLNLGSLTSNELYMSYSQGIEISYNSDLENINLENLQSSIERVWIQSIGNTMSVNLNSLISVPSSMSLFYDSDILNLPNLSHVNSLSINGHRSEVNLESLETAGSIHLNSTDENLTSVNLSSLVTVDNINLNNNHLVNLDLNNLISVGYLTARNNHITSIGLNNLEDGEIQLGDNLLSDVALPNINNLIYLDLSNNPLNSLNLFNSSIGTLVLSNSGFDMLDFSNVFISNLRISDCTNLNYLNLKNGTTLDNATFNNLPNLNYICVDSYEKNYIDEQLSISGILNCVTNSYCSFVPGGEFYTIQGENKLDLDVNGCDFNDTSFPYFKLSITNGSETGEIISNSTGGYSIPILEGEHVITPVLENPNYYAVSPESVSINFPSESSPYNQDFCITPNGTHNDLEIVIIPLEEARPGFDTDYKVIYKNKGNTVMSNSLEFSYNENAGLMELVSSTPVADTHVDNVLTWSFTDLMPFETKEILVTMNLNSPTDTPPLNGGDDLGFVANIFPITGDEIPGDNNFQLKQEVVNSFDPNDKTCLQGETIAPQDVGKYVHYLIRFENTGTASAVNIVVKDEIDMAKYDVSSLIPLDGSHDFVTRIKDDNIVEFIFEDINLPFDDANNDGYVLFKIKTLETLVLGDTFSNDAEIYFDYNAPIITNDEMTTVAENLSVEETELQNLINIYPNPASDVLNLESQTNLKSINIYDVHGRQIFTQLTSTNQTQINVSQLSKGVYFLNIKTANGEQTSKFIKQ